jgi:AraC-like DNA-binding protein
MEFLGIIFGFISFLLAFLAAIILLFVNKELRHSNRILAFMLFFFSLLNLNGVVLYSQWMLKIPWFYKVSAPFSLLITPAAYLYVRSILQGELKFRKYDWLLLLPTVLFAIDLMPFYFMAIEEKKILVIGYLKNKSLQAQFSEGVLPPYVFSFFRLSWLAVFIILNFRLIARFKKQATKQILIYNKELLRWLHLLNGLMISIIIVALVAAIIAPIKKTNLSLSDLGLGIIVMMICVQLFIRPKLLYGVFQPIFAIPVYESIASVNKEKTGLVAFESSSSLADILLPGLEIGKPVPELTISQSDSYRHKKTIESFFENQKPFLQTDYSLERLVADINIHRYALSAFINREYGMGFREFLNRYRVNYFKDNVDNHKWKNLTLEAIAEQCGFNSRSTFIKNFKEITGQTPSEYIKTSKE